MRKLFIFFLPFYLLTFCAAVVPLSKEPITYAGQLIYQIKDAAHPFGCVLYKNVNYKVNQPCIEVLAGIGERGSGSLSDLKKIGNWAIFQTLFQAADVFGFNVVFVQTTTSYQFGELPYAYQQALTTMLADPNSIHFWGHSNGGYGFQQEVSKDASLATRFATITLTSPGPGTAANTAKNIADSKRPCYIFTSAIDTASGTSYKVADNLYNAIIAAGGIAYETKYLDKNMTAVAAHNAVASKIVAAFGQVPNNWLPVSTGTAVGLNNYKITWYQWMLNNHLVGSIKSPLDPIVVTTPAPVPQVIHDTVTITLPRVHDTVWVHRVIHDTIAPALKIKTYVSIFNDGSLKIDSLP